MDLNATIVAPAVAALISGAVIICLQEILLFKKKKKADQSKTDLQHDEERANQMFLILKSLDAIGKLTCANSIALEKGKTNGEMKAAMKEYNDIQEKLHDYFVAQGLK